jgi:hypothetical protein
MVRGTGVGDERANAYARAMGIKPDRRPPRPNGRRREGPSDAGSSCASRDG